jgi:hypothetical protein
MGLIPANHIKLLVDMEEGDDKVQPIEISEWGNFYFNFMILSYRLDVKQLPLAFLVFQF